MKRRILLTLVVLGAVGAFAGFGTYSAFTATASNSGDTFVAGSVAISENDGGTAMLALTAGKPGDTSTSCIYVTSTGTLNSGVRIYSTLTGTLGQYLTLTVTRGTDSAPSFGSCATFTPDVTNYNGNGAGVVYSGNLSAFPTTYATAIVDPKAATPVIWAQNEAHAYKFVVTVQNNDSAQGLSASAGFTWEARNA